MQRINGTMIEVTRGDELNLTITLESDDETPYEFQVGDVVRFAVYNKNRFTDPAVLEKEITVEQATESISITCLSEETKIGDYINKPVDYWYEIELNGKNTVLGYDNMGAKIFRLYPEGYEE